MIYTGKYENCKSGNLISISGDRGKKVGFEGKCIPKFAPKLVFWKIWEENIGKIDELENTKYYINEYYKQVLINLDIEEILRNEKNPILLCYEDSDKFCHRHILAEYIELKYGIKVQEIEIDEKGNIIPKERPKYIKEILIDVILENGLEKFQKHGCFNCEYVIDPETVDSIINENEEYSEMSYSEAVEKIGHCLVTPYDYGIKHNYHCKYYYPNSECLEKCKVLKR
ncbi:MAG: hypothetical protein IK137_01620 [Bacilli bacterium]|nr:hypothetical protein [Bacilli bacterium]